MSVLTSLDIYFFLTATIATPTAICMFLYFRCNFIFFSDNCNSYSIYNFISNFRSYSAIFNYNSANFNSNFGASFFILPFFCVHYSIIQVYSFSRFQFLSLFLHSKSHNYSLLFQFQLQFPHSYKPRTRRNKAWLPAPFVNMSVEENIPQQDVVPFLRVNLYLSSIFQLITTTACLLTKVSVVVPFNTR